MRPIPTHYTAAILAIIKIQTIGHEGNHFFLITPIYICFF